MNIIFVCYTHLNSNSGIHIFNLANRLTQLGHHCAVSVPNDVEGTNAIGKAEFPTLLASEFERSPYVFPDGRGPDLIHGWTPREIVRHTVEKLAYISRCPYFVHLEDNEEHLTEATLGRPLNVLLNLPSRKLDSLITQNLAHPVRYKSFLAGAAGITALLDTLLEFKPLSVPGCVIWPSADEELEWALSPGMDFRREIGLNSEGYVVAYTGNVHSANRADVASLYIAIALLNRRGIPVKLVRTGIDHIPLFEPEGWKVMEQFVIQLGFVPRNDIPRVLSIADALVQPGGECAFNNYRFPSKLPEFFASGKFIVLGPSNLGKYVVDNVHCKLLKQGHAHEIAKILEDTLPDLSKRIALGTGAKSFADANFSWQQNARRLSDFYVNTL